MSFEARRRADAGHRFSWDDKNFVVAIEKSGKRKIVLAGLWTETCVALPTIQAIHDNYEYTAHVPATGAGRGNHQFGEKEGSRNVR